MGEAPARLLIVNADDFGRSHGINRGIFVAHDEGIVTSASLMVRWPAASDAALFARTRPSLSVGLHLDLSEWRNDAGTWEPTYEVVDAGDPEAVTAEVWRQIGRFDQLLGRYPTHIDSHQHAHRHEPARSAVLAVAGELGIPVREETGGVTYCGVFHGQSGKGEPYPEGITDTALAALIAALPPGTTELACHPGFGGDSGSVYDAEREVEVETLCSAVVRLALDQRGVTLVSYHDVIRATFSGSGGPVPGSG